MNKLPELFQALGNNTRFKIVEILMDERRKAKNWDGMCVCDIISKCKVANSTMTHHLDWLRSVGILKSEKRGKWIYYDVNMDTLNTLKKEFDRMI